MSVGMLEHFRRGWQGQSFYTTGKSLTKYTVRVLEIKRPRPNTIIRIFRIFEVIRVIKGIKAIDSHQKLQSHISKSSSTLNYLISHRQTAISSFRASMHFTGLHQTRK